MAPSDVLASLGDRPVPSLIITIGLRQGGLLEELDRRSSSSRVLALEPDPLRARALLTQPAARAWQSAGRLTCLTGPDYVGADQAFRLFPDDVEDHALVVDPAIASSPGPDAVQAARVAKNIVFGARANADARRRFAPRYLTNSLRNLPAIARGHDVVALRDAYPGVPAVVVAAGPSLDGVIPQLAAMRERALIIAADTALRPLLTAGVAPHLVVGLDPSALNGRHFRGLPPCPDTWLVSESALDPAAAAHFDGRTFWFRVSTHEPWPWYQELGLDVGVLEVWGSVVTAAFQVARLAGCDPIAFVGADLSYTGGRPYARGTTYEFDWAYGVMNGVPLEAQWRASIASDPAESADIHGRPVPTRPSLIAFRDWLVSQAARSGRRVVNATGAGMFVGPGVEQASLESIGSRATSIALPGSFSRRVCTTPEACRRAVVEAADAMALGTTPLAERWARFAANQLASHELEAVLREVASRFTGTLDTTTLHPVPRARVLLPQLPERAGRWRALLRGDEVEGMTADGDDAALDAVDVLASRLLETLTASGDAGVRVAGRPASLPLSLRFEWSDATRWDALALDAALGTVADRALAREISDERAAQGDVDAVAALQRLRTACGLLRARRAIGAIRLGSDVVMRVRARALVDEGVPRARVSYATPEGVVCVPTNDTHSLIVDAHGVVREWRRWPRVIEGELPAPDGGFVAWANDEIRWPQPGRATLLIDDGEAITSTPLPFAPQFGTWHGNRLYWSCFPFGVGTWAPGEAPQLHHDDIAFWGVRLEDGEFELPPRVRAADGGRARVRVSDAYRWRPGHVRTPVPLDARGACSDRTTHGGWTASAYPEADVITLEGFERALTLTCPYPLRVAWAGTSLVVSSADAEVWLFEDLAGHLRAGGQES